MSRQSTDGVDERGTGGAFGNGTLDELVSGVRFGKFASVGAIGAVFDLTISTVLTLADSVPPAYAKLVGAEVAIVVMFLINERWTFASQGRDGRRHVVRRFVTSNVVRSGGLLIQFLVVLALGRLAISLPVAGVDLWRILPFPIAIGASMFFNYVAESLVTWQVTSD